MKKPLKLIAGALLLSSVLPAAALAETPDLNNEKTGEMLSTSFNELPPVDLESEFTDASGTQYADAVQFLVTNGFALGKTPTYFGVHEPITRIDAAVIFANYLPLYIRDAPKSSFTDVPKRAQKAVDILSYYRIINGKSQTKYDSYSNITRGEAALMLFTAHESDLQTNQPKEVPDFSDVSDRYRYPVQALTAAGILKGKSDGRFGIQEPLTRGQLALIIERVSEFNAKLGEIDDAEYPIEDQGVSITTNKTSYELSVDRKLIITLKNINDYTIYHSPVFTLQKQVEGAWYEVPYNSELIPHTGFDEVDANGRKEVHLGLERKEFRSPLQAGEYRIVQRLFSIEGEVQIGIAAHFQIYE